MYLDRAMAGTKHFWSDNLESDIAEYTAARIILRNAEEVEFGRRLF